MYTDWIIEDFTQCSLVKLWGHFRFNFAFYSCDMISTEFFDKKKPIFLGNDESFWSKHVLKAERKLSRKLAKFFFPNSPCCVGKISLEMVQKFSM